MDGENKKGKPYEQMDDLGGPKNPLFMETPKSWDNPSRWLFYH